MATTVVDTTKSGDVVVGIDTHKYVHVGAVFDTTAGLLSTISVPADSRGFSQSLSWAESFGTRWPSASKGPAPTVVP
jgi:hypothetical protein